MIGYSYFVMIGYSYFDIRCATGGMGCGCGLHFVVLGLLVLVLVCWVVLPGTTSSRELLVVVLVLGWVIILHYKCIQVLVLHFVVL
jgi:hypothetical protein